MGRNTMNDTYSGIFYSLTKNAGIGTIIGAGVGTAAVGLALHDAIRAMRYSHKDIGDLVAKNPVDAKSFVKSLDSKIKVVSSPKDVDKLIKKEMSQESIGTRLATKQMMDVAISSKDNAFAMAGDSCDYVIAAPMVNPVALEHEVGHIRDFRDKRKKGTMEDAYSENNGFLREIGRMFVKSIHDSDIIAKEKAAWGHVSPGSERKEMEDATLNSYNRAFHSIRGGILGTLGGGTLGFLLGKRLGSPIIGGLVGAAAGNIPNALAIGLTEGIGNSA